MFAHFPIHLSHSEYVKRHEEAYIPPVYPLPGVEHRLVWDLNK